MLIPISQSVVIENILYSSGINPVKNGNIPENFSTQMEIVLDKLINILSINGFGIDDIVFFNGYLKSMNYYQDFNDMYKSFLSPPYPARKIITTGFIDERILLEVNVIAHRGLKKFTNHSEVD